MNPPSDTLIYMKVQTAIEQVWAIYLDGMNLPRFFVSSLVFCMYKTCFFSKYVFKNMYMWPIITQRSVGPGEFITNSYICNTTHTLMAQGTSWNRVHQDCKSLRTRKSAVRLCLLGMRGKLHSCHSSAIWLLNENWTMTISIDMLTQQGNSHGYHTQTKN